MIISKYFFYIIILIINNGYNIDINELISDKEILLIRHRIKPSRFLC